MNQPNNIKMSVKLLIQSYVFIQKEMNYEKILDKFKGFHSDINIIKMKMVTEIKFFFNLNLNIILKFNKILL